MKLFPKIALNTAVLVIAKAITVIFGLGTTILLTRYLGQSGFGEYTFVLSYIVLFGALADWGTALIGVREAATNVKEQKEILGTVFLVRFLLSLIALILAFLGIQLLPLSVANPLLIKQAVFVGCFLIVLLATKASFGIVFQTRFQLHKYAFVEVLVGLMTFLFSAWLINAGGQLIDLIWAIILTNLGGLLISFLMTRSMMTFTLKPSRKFLKYLGKEALPMGAVLVIFSVYNRIDTVILASLKGSSAVGLYGVGYRVYDVLVLVAAYFMQSMLPVLSKYAGKNDYNLEFRRIYQIAFDILLVLGLMMLVFVFLFAPVIIRVVAGSDFLPSVTILRLLAVAALIAFFNHLTGYTIVALHQQRSYVKITVMALMLNVFLNLWLIPGYSYLGAATATIATEGLVLFLTSRLIGDLTNIKLRWSHFPVTIRELIIKRGHLF